MSKHTPGPWHVSNPTHIGKWAGFGTWQGKYRGIYATGENLEAIAMVPKDYLLHEVDQDFEANARLIAAAPEMYDFLKEVLDSYSFDEINFNKIESLLKRIHP